MRPALLALPCVLLALPACGADPQAVATPPSAAAAVTASETSCSLDRTELPAGVSTFALANDGTGDSEVYVYAADGRVVSEKLVAAGKEGELTARLDAGSYEIACKPGGTGDGVRAPFTVRGASAALPADEAAAVEAYRAYVQQQADALVPLVQGFVAAVKAGDVARAKALYAPSRVPWEAVEPVAESFGDLDPRVDLREADLEPGGTWTGWHRIEKALWVDGSTAGLAPVADQLVADVSELRERVGTAELTAASIGNGAKELLDEVATGKITGEEEAFSHTDLVDVHANVSGARKAFDVLRPLVDDAALVDELEAAFATVDAALDRYRRGSGFVSYDTVDAAGRRELARAVDALGEPLSRLSAAATA